MLVRPGEETTEVALAVVASGLGIAAATHAWLASGLFTALFILRFALQPPAGAHLQLRRRVLLAVMG